MPKNSANTAAPARRSNETRSAQTRQALIRAARKLFVERGVAATSTPDIVTEANVTRGALYHHFADKTDLVRAVIRAEAATVADEINRTAAEPETALGALLEGATGYFNAMAKPGRARLLLIDGPAVLGPDAMSELNSETSTATLRDGLTIAMDTNQRGNQLPINEIAEILGAGFDRAALAIASGEPTENYHRAFEMLFTQLVEGANKG